MSFIRWSGWLLLLILCGCQTQPPLSSPVEDAGVRARTETEPESVPERDRSPEMRSVHRPEPGVESDKSFSAVKAIETEARQFIQKQQWQQAIASAEHGLRINRRYAPFYQILAEGYRALENYHQAAQFARQALRFCGNHCAEIQVLLDTIESH